MRLAACVLALAAAGVICAPARGDGGRGPQNATILGPANPLFVEGAQALEQGRYEEGIRLTLAGLELPSPRGELAIAHSNLCAGYAALRRWDEALEHCNVSLSLDRTNWRTFNNRAAVLSGKQLFELALADVQSGLELAPESATLKETLRIIRDNMRVMREAGRAAVKS